MHKCTEAYVYVRFNMCSNKSIFLYNLKNSYCKYVGEQIEINFEVYVSKDCVSALSCRRDFIEDILILHLEGGKDFFVNNINSHLYK